MGSLMFLQGESHIGKSTLLQEVLTSYTGRFLGFQVQRRMEKGEICGYGIQLVEEKLPLLEVPIEEKVNYSLYSGKTKTYQVLEEVLDKIEEICSVYPADLLLLDEIGGGELIEPKIREKLYHMFSKDIPCIGVFKSHALAEGMGKRRGLPSIYLQYHEDMEKWIEEHGQLLTMNHENREVIKKQLHTFLKLEEEKKDV